MNHHALKRQRDPVQGLALLLISTAIFPAIASSSSASQSQSIRQPIVVTGERLAPDVARDRAAKFVREAGVAAGDTPAARWVDPVCPEVTGLHDDGKRVAEAEIRRIAAEAGVDVAPAPCPRNLVVTFTPDAAGLARQLAVRAPGRLQHLSPVARTALLTGSAPVRWLYTVETRDRHGGRGGDGVSIAGGTDQNSSGSGYGAPLPSNGAGFMHYESSILSTLTNRVLTSAIILVDTDDVTGKPLSTVAAYAALVGLAEIRDLQASPEGSILGLLTSPSPPRTLTRQDDAFLRTLYRIPLDRRAALQRGVLVRGIVAQLSAGTPAQSAR